MGQDELNGPPKKKLKQAQLNFFNSPKQTVNSPANKRKVVDEPSSDDEVQFVKVICKSADSPEQEKENVGSYKINRKEKICSVPGRKSELNEAYEVDATFPENERDSVKRKSETKSDCDPLQEMDISTDVSKGDSEQETLNVDTKYELEKHEQENETSEITNFPEAKKNFSIDEEDDSNKDTLAFPLDTSLSESQNKLEVTKPEIIVSVSDSVENSPSKSCEETGNELLTPNVTDVSLIESENESTKNHDAENTPVRKLTPKQLKRRENSLKKQAESEKIKSEKKAAKDKRKEEKIKIKNEQEEQKKRAKEEKQKKKLAEQEQKNEEKRMKLEDRRLKKEKEEGERKKKEEEKKKKKDEKRKEDEAKEEEKKKKEEAKLQEKRKEEQAKVAFASFFKKSQREIEAGSCVKVEDQSCGISFMPFQVKSDMKVAPVIRRNFISEAKCKLDKAISESNEKGNILYLNELKSGRYKPLNCEATWPVSAWEEQHDVIIVESMDPETTSEINADEHKKNKTSYRAKLLQFCENRRPAYWGTWRKKTNTVSARRPFSKDISLDYEVDSDSEWEDEEEGESLEEDEKEKEQSDEEVEAGENGYVLDKQFVPHGYLSDEEAQAEDTDDISPEAQKLRLIVLKEEFDEEMQQKAERLKPRLLGCVWISNETSEVSKGSLYERLLHYRCVWDEAAGPVDILGDPDSESPNSTPMSSSKIKQFPPLVLDSLVKFVHGSRLPLGVLLKEFLEIVQQNFSDYSVSKISITRKIKELATKKLDSNGKSVWAIKNEFLSSYGLESLTKKSPDENVPQQVEKPKNTFLDSFLKGNTAKKRIVLMSLGEKKPKGNDKDDVILVESPQTVVPEKKDTPRCEPKKKKVPFITLPQTPQQSSARSLLHQDTPRPSVNVFLNKQNSLGSEEIDLTSDTD